MHERGQRKPSRSTACRRTCRSGSTYVLILSVSLVVTVIGLTAVAVSRTNTRTVGQSNDWCQAQRLAFSAAEHALLRIAEDPNWRTALAGVEIQSPLGTGRFRWRVVDEEDGDLSDGPSDPAAIIATGTTGEASYSLHVDLNCVGQPLEALDSCLSADGKIEVRHHEVIDLDGGCLASNERVINHGTILGDVETPVLKGHGVVTGSVTPQAAPRAMPDASAFDTYRQKATQIPFRSKLDKVVLSPSSNPWGQPNPDGVYYIDAGNRNLTVRGCRIEGTLVIRCARRKRVVIDREVFMQNYRADHPVLIVDGDAEISMRSLAFDLSESTWHTNFNPSGTPYEGDSDGDRRDNYPNEIRGLVHVRGDLTMKQTARIRGAIVCEGKVKFDGDNQITYDPDVAGGQPMGYTQGGGQVVPGQWRRLVN